MLEAVYEQDFSNCSYRFRPRRSAHRRFEAFWKQSMKIQGGYVVEIDIQKYSIRWAWPPKEGVNQRVRDGVIRRAIDKWLKAGVMEEEVLWNPENR